MTIDNLKQGSLVYCVGIKGTGVCALAELLHNAGMKVSGSDMEERFYTDDILKELRIPFHENFDTSHITKDIDIIIYSAAYSEETNPELARAAELNIPMVKYTDALGQWSARFDSTGVCGVHGKTTTTALCGVCARAADLPAQILTGSAVLDFGGKSTLNMGDKFFIAETCEYRKHFLSFHPKRIILTSVESDHQDYFPDHKSIIDAFVEYCELLPKGGQLIYCFDDPGAREVVSLIKNKNDIELIPYGFEANGDYKILSYRVENAKGFFSLAGIVDNSGKSAAASRPVEFILSIPGKHEALNVAAALALTVSLHGSPLDEKRLLDIKDALFYFKCAKRRSEIIGEVQCKLCKRGSILFMDDYAHHPTAVKTTLAGLKSFYPNRRLIASFMSHTYTRTAALFNEFASCFNDADVLFLHKIYSSAREKYSGIIDGKALYKEAVKIRKEASRKKETYYIDEPLDAFDPVRKMLKSGDLFITLGAGNNFPLVEKLYKHFGSR